MSISSDEINYLIYRYLQENGFHHTAFCFESESLFTRSSVSHIDVPPGALITFLQKGLEYIGIEEHINEDGSVRDFDRNYSLLSPFVCDAVAIKKEKRRSSQSLPSHPDIVPMEENRQEPSISNSNSNSIKLKEELGETRISTIKFEGGTKWLQLQGHQGEVFISVWNPVQLQLASGSADGMCRLWDLHTTPPSTWSSDPSQDSLAVRMSVMPHSQYAKERCKDVTSVNWSSNGLKLATGCYDGTVRLWENTGVLSATLQEHNGPVFSLKWNKTSTYLLSGSYDKRVIVWDPVSGTVVKVYSIHNEPVLDVDWRDGDLFASCSSDKNIHICCVQPSSSEALPLKTLQGHLDEVNAVVWSPGGLLLASCSDDTTAKVWSARDGLKFDLRGHTKEIYTVRWTPTGPGSVNPNRPLQLCTASFDGTVKVWSAETGEMVYNLRRQAQPVYSISASPNGELLATGSLGGHVSIWSLRDGSLVREVHGGGDTFDVAWSHDGAMLSSCFSSGMLYILDARI
mmetsp:Transcript_2900/g.3058  ORF Transcript_2900/g.3058 Transcript_2900/m.3058 type:complete len:514 (-) Transcript_2900:132-1673(-)|eukprot:CAMPEP_0182422394 /NCGR_PEP_ID=MMETSP1167-20130531/8070_1 /TAXON_ID=2988 /ORGANISM="Mallomonas Sp, Strain CCMP3275" /LENGTH=513 /DNA_ID=CAMNT_0024600413 /DNA_START=68 /DNA_END=1609 /DNA_ORIENTATION=+